MNKKLAKYFWNLNEKAVREVQIIIKNPNHPKFAMRMVTLLSRCQQPKEFFSFISKDEFVKGWPKVKSYWMKVTRSSDFRDWWQTIYEQLLQKDSLKQINPKIGKTFDMSLRIGKVIQEARIKMGLNQKELALRLGMKQPDICNIEKGKKNITLETLSLLCKALGIKRLELW